MRFAKMHKKNRIEDVEKKISTYAQFSQTTLGVKVRNMKWILTFMALGVGSGNEH